MVALSCSAAPPLAPPPRPARHSPPAATRREPAPDPASPTTPAASPTLLITEPSLLHELEGSGLSLARVLGEDTPATDNASLSASPRFAPLVQELEQETQRAGAADKLAGVDVARFSHRLFDRRFLRLPQARFALAGVVNRPDRAAFAAASCGEVRLIYRLEYRLDEAHASKLPMTLGVELQVPHGADGCRSAAARWLEPSAANAQQRAQWLRSAAGPLAPERLRLQNDNARVVVNLQLVRWPSTVRPDLGGHAEYLLRSFRPDDAGVLRPEPLENTVAAAAFQAPARQRALLALLEQQAKSIDAGTVVLPDSVLAKRAVSVTPRGLNRLANRPFSAALSTKLLKTRDFTGGRFVKSPEALLRRLDELSCSGCHQARSVAGFHLLGEDEATSPNENALALPVSPQVLADLPRRLRIAQALLHGEAPDFAAPFAERPSDAGGYGDACSLGDDPSFNAWHCAPSLSCSASEAHPGDPVGHCLPTLHGVGDACEHGSVSRTADAHRDRLARASVESCPDMVCNRSAVGFPGGMCTATCGADGSRCGAIAILDPFNACLARGESFIACIRGNVTPAGLRACDAENPCRDDYVCAKTAQGGACLPPYFVFQLRVDGHSSSLR